MATMTPDQIAQWATAHEEARRSATQIEPPSFTNPDMDLDDAYAIQQAWVDLQIADGARLVGHKIGLTSKAMQASMQINEPDLGALLDTMVYDDGAELTAATFCDPKIEVELAFVSGCQAATQQRPTKPTTPTIPRDRRTTTTSSTRTARCATPSSTPR